MKKILGIVFLWLLLSSVGIAIENLEIKKVNYETETIKIKKNYKLSCEIDLLDLSGIYTFFVNENNNLISNIIFDFEDDGSIFIKGDRKINKKGKLSKSKFKIEYSSDLDGEIKKEMKSFKKIFKTSISKGFVHEDIYGSTLTPGRKISKSSKIRTTAGMKMLALMTGEKKFKKMTAKIYEEFLGYALLGDEKFYVLEEGSEFSHPDKEFLEEYTADAFPNYILIHILSGLSIKINEEATPVCSIYNNDQILVEFDTSEFFN